MSKNRNKININSLTEQLDNIVEEYNNIDFDISLNQPSVVSLENKLSLLNQENQFLENELHLTYYALPVSDTAIYDLLT